MLVAKKIIFLFIGFISKSYAKLKVSSMGVGCKVNRFSIFTKETHIGKYCHFNGIKVIGGGRLIIGDYFHSGIGIQILTQNHNYYSPNKLPYDDEYIFKEVIIGKGVWIGNNVIILPGTQIGDGVVVQAGSVLHGKISEGSVVGGNPAKVIMKRDMNTYFKLKNENKYSQK
jgi:acetyltransferase-like isoleucine patch superfamily enzyme